MNRDKWYNTNLFGLQLNPKWMFLIGLVILFISFSVSYLGRILASIFLISGLVYYIKTRWIHTTWKIIVFFLMIDLLLLLSGSPILLGIPIMILVTLLLDRVEKEIDYAFGNMIYWGIRDKHQKQIYSGTFV